MLRQAGEEGFPSGVLIIPGGYFFYGLADAGWKHREESICVSYAMDEAAVHDGLRIIAEEVRAASPSHS